MGKLWSNVVQLQMSGILLFEWFLYLMLLIEFICIIKLLAMMVRYKKHIKF